MNKIILILLQVTWKVIAEQDYYYRVQNVTRTTLSGLAAYRSALTLGWFAAEDSRQRDLVSAFETDPPPAKLPSDDCVAYPKPAPGKVARLMLELLKNLEGDDGILISELVQALLRSKLLVQTSVLEAEPDFESLVKTPAMMIGEPHSTLPRVVAAIWMLVSDPVTTRNYGWCPIKQVSKYLVRESPRDIARHMKSVEVIVARARFVMKEFIQNVTPIDMYQRNFKEKNTPNRTRNTRKHRRLDNISPSRRMDLVPPKAVIQSATSPTQETETVQTPQVFDKRLITLDSGACVTSYCTFSVAMFIICFVINCF